jgi:hypothetical protein
VVAVLCRVSKTLAGVAEKAETGEEVVDTLTESQRECPGGREEEEVVDVRSLLLANACAGGSACSACCREGA